MLLNHVVRSGVDQDPEAAPDEVKHAAGGGYADPDGVHATTSGGEAGNPGLADHTVALALAQVQQARIYPVTTSKVRGSKFSEWHYICSSKRSRSLLSDRSSP